MAWCQMVIHKQNTNNSQCTDTLLFIIIAAGMILAIINILLLVAIYTVV